MYFGSAWRFSWWSNSFIITLALARVIIKVKGHQEKWRDDSKCILPDQNHVITIIVTCKGFAIQDLKNRLAGCLCMGSRTRSTNIFLGKENPQIIKNKLLHLPVGNTRYVSCLHVYASFYRHMYIHTESFNAILQIKLWNVCCRVHQHCVSHVTQSTTQCDLSSFAFGSRISNCFIPLSHYSKNVLRTYYEHKMSTFVV